MTKPGPTYGIATKPKTNEQVSKFGSQPYPAPPAPLLEYMLSELWLFRDSNWSPNVPTSAQTAIDLYAISRDVQPAGVIALDQQAVRLLIEALGPLHVEGYSEPITGQNVIHMARQAWNPGDQPSDDWWPHRKDFMFLVLAGVARRRLGAPLAGRRARPRPGGAGARPRRGAPRPARRLEGPPGE